MQREHIWPSPTIYLPQCSARPHGHVPARPCHAVVVPSNHMFSCPTHEHDASLVPRFVLVVARQMQPLLIQTATHRHCSPERWCSWTDEAVTRPWLDPEPAHALTHALFTRQTMPPSDNDVNQCCRPLRTHLHAKQGHVSIKQGPVQNSKVRLIRLVKKNN